jgi:CRP-like cAMP-binding protein
VSDQERAGRPPSGRLIAVLERDPDLLEGLSSEQAADARRRARAPAVTLEPGPWATPSGPGERFRGHLGLLVLDGLMTRNIAHGPMRSTELIGGGDLLRPWSHDDRLGSLPVSTSWFVLRPTTLAVLDGRFAEAVCRWPPVVVNLMERSVQRTRWLAVQLAIAHHRRVDTRLLLLFWHLADRWGRVHREGVVVPVRLTHALVASLIGAQRPSVSAALQELSGRGAVVRQPDGSWLLRGGPPRVEDAPAEAHAGE